MTGSGPLPGNNQTTVCAECGGPVDPDVTHVQHAEDCALVPYWECPYLARYESRPGHDPEATCAFGCWQEPACVTDGPWPPEARNDCDCPEVCASCCTDPDCPLARQIPGQLTPDEAT